MGKSSYFCDLRISDEQSSNNLKDTLQILIKLGYKTVAIDHILDEAVFQSTEAKRKKGQPAETPILVPPPKQFDDEIKLFEGKIKILHRLTVSLADKLQAYKLSKSENVNKYNLLAVLPKTELAFQYACSTMEVDIITFNPTNNSTMKLNRKMYHMAVERGVYFEVMYAPAIRDSSARRNTIHVSHLYHTFGKSKNIILTSGATTYTQIRGPYDIINLGLIFGLSEEQSKAALTNVCRSLLISAEGRRHGKATVLVSRASEPPCDDADSPNKKRVKMDEEESPRVSNEEYT